jgi:anti-anti-sigma factor
LDAERDLSDGTSPPEPREPCDVAENAADDAAAHTVANTGDPPPAGPQPSPADLERLQRLLTEFSVTPVFARILAGWTGPAASMLAAEASGDASPARHAAPKAFAALGAGGDSSALSARVSGNAQCAVVAAFGEIRTDTVGLLIAAAWRALGDAPAELVVDLREITHFSAAGVRALLELRDAAADVATDLRLRAPSDAVRRVIEAMSARSAFEIDYGDTRAWPARWPSEPDTGDAAQRPRHAAISRRN